MRRVGQVATLPHKIKKNVRAVLRITESYQPILLIFTSKHGIAYGCIISKFEQNLTKNYGGEIAAYENSKMVADDVIKLIYRKSEKNNTGQCPQDYLCEVSSKSAQPFRL